MGTFSKWFNTASYIDNRNILRHDNDKAEDIDNILDIDISKNTVCTTDNSTLKGHNKIPNMSIVISRPKNIREILCCTKFISYEDRHVSIILKIIQDSQYKDDSPLNNDGNYY